MNLLTKQKEIYGLREWVCGCRREGFREGIVREFGMGMYTPLYLKWMTNQDLLYSTWNSSQCYVADWMGGEFGGEWIHVYIWLSPFALHLKLSQHYLLISYKEWIHVYIWMSPFALHLKLSQHCLLISCTPVQKVFFFLNKSATLWQLDWQKLTQRRKHGRQSLKPWLKLSQNFLDGTQKTQTMKEKKINKSDFIEMRTFWSLKENEKKSLNWEKPGSSHSPPITHLFKSGSLLNWVLYLYIYIYIYIYI